MFKRLIKSRLLIVSCLLLAPMAFVSGRPRTPALEKIETRCGWFSNPTPANASLFDRESEWIIGVQGGYQAEGDWFSSRPMQWVKTNGNYGYGCVCLRLRVNRETHEVIEIISSRPRQLSACRQDRRLRRWGFR